MVADDQKYKRFKVLKKLRLHSLEAAAFDADVCAHITEQSI